MGLLLLIVRMLLFVKSARSFQSTGTQTTTFQRSHMPMGGGGCDHVVVDVNHDSSISVPSDPTIRAANDITRQNILQKSISCILASSYVVLGQPQPSIGANHRQLELCLVAVLRVVYWAQYELQQIDDTMHTDHIDRQRAIYLETRLGAKAALTGRITGTGATNRVYLLTTLQLPGCLQDLEWYLNANSSTRKNIGDDVCTLFREGMASIVEFDGLDSLSDPSPRSALTLSQYNTNKLKLIRRTLNERIIPDGQKLAFTFGPEAYQQSYGYVQQYYSAEIPVLPPKEGSE
jgi:hypothetical protein